MLHVHVIAGLLAARLAHNPADHLTMVGVTGTSGKTTTATLIDRTGTDDDCDPDEDAGDP